MSKKLLFAIIASVVVGHAFADSKTITTQDYVDAADALKQDKITAGTTGAVVTYNGEIDGQAQFSERAIYDDWEIDPIDYRDDLSTAGVVLDAFMELDNFKQTTIPASGYRDLDGMNPYNTSDLLNVDVKGTGLVTRTATDGIVGERQIIETADVANYGTGTATEQQIQEISIPTMGAVMAAISANAPTLPTGTAGNVVTYNASGQIGGSVATYNGSTTYNASNDASKIAVMSAVQRKMTCARYVQNAAETPENCLLWNVLD